MAQLELPSGLLASPSCMVPSSLPDLASGAALEELEDSSTLAKLDKRARANAKAGDKASGLKPTVIAGGEVASNRDAEEACKYYFLARRLAAENERRKRETQKKNKARQEALHDRRRNSDTPSYMRNPQSARIHLCEDGVPRVVLRRTDLGTQGEHVKVLGLSTGRKSGITAQMFPARQSPSYSQLLKSFVAIQVNPALCLAVWLRVWCSVCLSLCRSRSLSHVAAQAFSKNELSFLKSRWAEHARRQEVPLAGLFAAGHQGAQGIGTALKAEAFAGVITETLLLESTVSLLQVSLHPPFPSLACLGEAHRLYILY
jgi:hypothetical protein